MDTNTDGRRRHSYIGNLLKDSYIRINSYIGIFGILVSCIFQKGYPHVMNIRISVEQVLYFYRQSIMVVSLIVQNQKWKKIKNF